MQTISIIGSGNMGASLIGGLIADGYAANHIWVTDPDTQKLAHLQTQFGIHTSTDNVEAVQHAQIVILAVKPQILATIAGELAEIVQKQKPLVISIAAGIREQSIQFWLGGSIPIVRSMPNTPALIGCGATALYANTWVSIEQRNLAETILRAVGLVVWLADEKLMDTVTALSGSGPAYFFFIMESLQKAAEQLGLPADTARLLTLQTALGAARMALESDESLTTLRERVTSPGGTTERAIKTLEENKLHDTLTAAIRAAQQRSEELATLFAEKTSRDK